MYHPTRNHALGLFDLFIVSSFWGSLRSLRQLPCRILRLRCKQPRDLELRLEAPAGCWDAANNMSIQWSNGDAFSLQGSGTSMTRDRRDRRDRCLGRTKALREARRRGLASNHGQPMYHVKNTSQLQSFGIISQ